MHVRRHARTYARTHQHTHAHAHAQPPPPPTHTHCVKELRGQLKRPREACLVLMTIMLSVLHLWLLLMQMSR
jgi:hypothetical protein